MVLGNIKLFVQVESCTFNSEFIVMDINLSYNCLLERPWIHMVGAVPLTLHQRVKFMADKNLITVVAEEDMVATTTISTPYIEVKKDATECVFDHLRSLLLQIQKTDLKRQHLIYHKIP